MLASIKSFQSLFVLKLSLYFVNNVIRVSTWSQFEEKKMIMILSAPPAIFAAPLKATPYKDSVFFGVVNSTFLDGFLTYLPQSIFSGYWC